MRCYAFEGLTHSQADAFFPFIAALCAAMFFVWMISARSPSPRMQILQRHLRLLLFGAAWCYMARKYFLPDTAPIPLFFSGALILLLLESVLFWMQIKLLNTEEGALTPRYKETSNAWRPGKKFSELKERIEKAGFIKRASYSSKIEGVRPLLLTDFISADSKTLLTVSFVPTARAYLTAACAISFAEETGEVFYTNGIFMPFGLSYPENYKVRFMPLSGVNPEKILKAHARLTKGTELRAIEESALAISNKFSADIEAQCAHDGLLNAPEDVEEYGKLSQEGLFRVWKALFLLNYFGIAK